MVETLGVDLKACVYLEIATGLALRQLMEKNAVSEWESLTRHPQARRTFRKVHFARVNSTNM
jgi:hypothetical protein